MERKARQIMRRFIPRQPAKPIDGRLGQRLKYYWRDRMRIVFEDEELGVTEQEIVAALGEQL